MQVYFLFYKIAGGQAIVSKRKRNEHEHSNVST